MEIYLVGGAVRDELLGLAVEEKDWVVLGSSPEEMLALGYKAVGKDFPVFLHPETKEEYALARTERKKGKGYYGFEVHASPEVSLEEDLLRRDLTINAIAKSSSGELIDPYKGQQDIQAKCIRHVSVAFTEDPLRVLRAARFAAKYAHLGFSVADETLTLMSEIVHANEIAELAVERIWQETLKALNTTSPWVYFDILHAVGALAQTHTSIDKQYSISQARENGLQALQQFAAKEKKAEDRFAAFVGGLFYLQKEDTTKDIQELNAQLKLPNSVKKLLQLTVSLQHDSHQVLELNAEQVLSLLQRLDSRRQTERFLSLLKIYTAIFTSIRNTDHYLQADFLQQAAQVIDNIDTQKWVGKGVSDQQLTDKLYAEKIGQLEKLMQSS